MDYVLVDVMFRGSDQSSPREFEGAGIESRFRLGKAVVDPIACRIELAGERLHVEHKVMQVLMCLVRGSGSAVSKREIFEDVWDGDAVTDDVLTRAVSSLRRVLGDDPRDPRYIQTVPREGYRLVASVRPVVARRRRVPAILLLGALLFLSALFWRWEKGSPSVPSGEFQSVAVLPLVNLTGEPSQDYLAVGMTETLIARLGHAPALQVVSLSSTVRYEGSRTPLHKIARELNVEALVVGSLQRSGDSLRVTLRLVEGSRGLQVWASEIDGDLSDIFALQRRAASRLLSFLRLPELGGLALDVDSAAAHAFLRGRYLASTGDLQKLREAVTELERTIELAPRLAAAHAALAESLVGLAVEASRPIELYVQAAQSAERALEIDPDNTRALAVRGAVLYVYEWNLGEAEEALREALSLNPSDAFAHDWLARVLASQGRFDEAIIQVRLLRQVDPLAYSRPQAATILYFSRRYDLAINELHSQLAIEPTSPTLRMHLARVLAVMGEAEQAVETLKQALPPAAEEPSRGLDRGSVEAAFARGGLTAVFRLIHDQLPPGSPASYRATLLAGAGDHEAAIRLLDEAAAAREPMLLGIAADPIFDGLRPDPRFRQLLHRIGLPELSLERSG